MGPLLDSPPLPLLPVDTHTHAHSRAHTQQPLLRALFLGRDTGCGSLNTTRSLFLPRSCRLPASQPSPAHSSRGFIAQHCFPWVRSELPQGPPPCWWRSPP